MRFFPSSLTRDEKKKETSIWHAFSLGKWTEDRKKSSIQTNDLHSSFEKPPSCPLFPSSKAVASTPPIGCVQFDDARDDKKTITEDGIVNGRANQYWIFIAFSSKLHHVLLTRFSRELKSFLVKKEPRGMGKRGSWWSRFHFMVADSFGVLMMLLLLLILPRSLLIKRASCESVFLWEDPTGFRS